MRFWYGASVPPAKVTMRMARRGAKCAVRVVLRWLTGLVARDLHRTMRATLGPLSRASEGKGEEWVS